MSSSSAASAMYVKIRGRAHGPLSMDKLREMVRKGQLSRIHQISDDGQSWRAAGELAELFETSVPAAGNVAHSSRSASAPAQPNEGDRVWYYNSGQQAVGPVTLAELRAMVPSGTLQPSNLVWREGQADWSPAVDLPDLRDLFQDLSPGHGVAGVQRTRNARRRRNREHDEASSPAGLSTETVHGMRGIASWSLFVAVMGFVYSGLLFVFGIFLIALAPELIPMGSSALLLAVLLLVGGLLLNQAALAMGRSERSSGVADLNAALRSWGRFWTCVGFSLIGFSIVVVFLIIVFFSAIVSILQRAPALGQ